jgi:carboxylesterase type B
VVETTFGPARCADDDIRRWKGIRYAAPPRDNIAAFGGDPQRVTLFGESAAAGIVATLLAALHHRPFMPNRSNSSASMLRMFDALES